MTDKTLQDLGERRIIKEILPKFLDGIDDDCAVMNLNGSALVLTTDPVPEPAAKLLGGDSDLYWMGWLLVTINASDLAAAGASGLGFLAAIDAPPSLATNEFERLLLGISDACKEEGLTYLGGNLREGSKLAGVGTAVGVCNSAEVLHRKGGKVGDFIISVGSGGIFWRDALIIKNEGMIKDKYLSPIFRPISQMKVMRLLAKEGLILAAIDNSDGLLPTLSQIAKTNSLGIRLNISSLPIPNGAQDLINDPARLWLGWGDWNVIAVVDPVSFEKVKEFSLTLGASIFLIGRFIEGSPEVFLSRGEKTMLAPRLESERFARDSWFSTGVEGYLKLLLEVPLP